MRATVVKAVLLGTAVLLYGAPAAFAAGADKVGQNIGDMLSGWAKPLFIGVAGIVVVKFLLARKIAEAVEFALGAVLIGGFVFAPAVVGHLIHGIWTTVTAGVG